MNRITFVKNLIGFAGLAAVPKEWIKEYDKYYLLQCFIRGFQFYYGIGLLERMKEGDMLQLVREPDNEHDKYAVALHWNGNMVGYLPREKNKILSKLLDIGVPELMAEITHLNPEAASWENVSVVVYVLKERSFTDTPASKPEYLTTLSTPEYYSLKHKDSERVTRIIYDKPLDYYSYMTSNSPDDGIYDMIHTNLSADIEYGVGDRLFVVNHENISASGLSRKILEQSGKWMQSMNIAFDDDKGYITLSMKEAEDLIPQISSLADKVDQAGNHFIELLFG